MQAQREAGTDRYSGICVFDSNYNYLSAKSRVLLTGIYMFSGKRENCAGKSLTIAASEKWAFLGVFEAKTPSLSVQ